MPTEIQTQPTVMVIFGAGGDLTWRKLVPALYDLYVDKWLPERFAVIGLDRNSMGNEEFRRRLREGVAKFSRRGQVDDEAWGGFASSLTFINADFSDPAAYGALADHLAAQDTALDTKASRIFYLATPPTAVETIVQQLDDSFKSF